jgi:hypothetical protein
MQVFFYRDGKTASVAVHGGPSKLVAIVTNGKPDAAINLDPAGRPAPDESTMSLLGALPLLIKPDARSVANIGFGSGLTAEVLLSHSGPRELDIIEIEPAMVAGARSFSPRVTRPYHDPRSRVFFEDAKNFFARHGRRYDVIISEPSNPWVNGVASLFTTEFYRDTKRYLAPDGLFVQWLQLYEFNDRLLGSVLAALGENFSDYEVYEANTADIIVVAVAEGRVPSPSALPEQEAAFIQQLNRVGIRRLEEVTVRSAGTKQSIAPLFAALAAPANSDFHPTVQLEATRARFQGSKSPAVLNMKGATLPIVEMVGGAPGADDTVPSFLLRSQSSALELQRGLVGQSVDPLKTTDESVRLALLTLKRPGALCGPAPSKTAIAQLHRAAEITLAHLAPEPRRTLWIERRWIGCTSVQLSPAVRKQLDIYSAIAARDPQAMLGQARALLEQGPQRGGDDWGRYLLLTAMLGAQSAADPGEARRLWSIYGKVLYPSGAIPPHVIYVVNLQ